MSCLPENTIQALVEGTIGPSERPAALAHLEGCEHCRALAAALARGLSGVQDTHRSPAGLVGGTPGAPVLQASVGRYVLRGKIGAGAMGVVYSAWDPQLGRPVALKVLRPPGAPLPSEGLSLYPREAQSRALLLHEARAAARLAHPNVVAIFDVVEDGDVIALAMEFVEGGTLQDCLARTAEEWPWPARARMLLAAGQGLACLHAQGLVHRDFKPANVLVGADGRPRVSDFGLVHLLPEARREGLDSTALEGIAGTPLYMAPEQLRGETVDARADVYAFCVTAWQALFSQRPTAALTWAQLVENTRRPPPPVPAGPVPARLGNALRRGLDPDAGRRPSMGELLQEFELALRPPASRRPLVLAAALLSVLLAGSVVVGARWWQERSRCDGLAATERLWTAEEQQRGNERLGRWVDEWRSLRRGACLREGALSASVGGAAEVCLEGLRPQFRNLVDAMAAPGLTEEQRDSLERLTPSLAPPSQCLSPPTVARSSPQDAATVLQAIALREVGKTKESIELASSTLARDAGVDPATSLSLFFARGMALQHEGRTDDALDDFAKAAAFAEVQHDDAARASSLVSEASILLLNRNDERTGLLILESARPLAERSAPPATKVELWLLDAELARRREKPADALALIHRAEALAHSVGDAHLELKCLETEVHLIAEGVLDQAALGRARELMAGARVLSEKRPALRDGVQEAYTEVLIKRGESAELLELSRGQLALLASNQTAHGLLLSTLLDWQLVRSAGDVEAGRRALERLPRRGRELDFLSTEFAVIETECRWLVEGPAAAAAVLQAAREKSGSALTEYTNVLDLQLRFAQGLPLSAAATENFSEWDLAVWRSMAGLEAARAGKLAEARQHLAAVPLPAVPEVVRTIPEWGTAMAFRQELRALVGEPAGAVEKDLSDLVATLEAQPSAERSRVLARLALAKVKRDCAALPALTSRLEALGTDPAALARAKKLRASWKCGS